MAATLGSARTLTVTLSSPLRPDAALPVEATLDADRREVRWPVANLSSDVTSALQQVAAAGGEVADLTVAGASLQDVFISLTGRELRE